MSNDKDGAPPGAELGPIDDPPNSAHFLRRAQRGDTEARNEMVMRYEARVRRIVSANMGSDLASFVDEEDVVQHTLAIALERVAEFEYRGPGSILKWLATIAIRFMNDERKKKNVRKATMSLDDVAGNSSGVAVVPEARSRGPATKAGLRDEVAKFDECIRRLPHSWRQLVVLRFYGELNFGEIARAIGDENEDAVWQRFNRAYTKVLSCWQRPRSEHSAA